MKRRPAAVSVIPPQLRCKARFSKQWGDAVAQACDHATPHRTVWQFSTAESTVRPSICAMEHWWDRGGDRLCGRPVPVRCGAEFFRQGWQMGELVNSSERCYQCNEQEMNTQGKA